jgi:L-ascorbate metabolism protein UlaG (beta-lactamase superfamily)
VVKLTKFTHSCVRLDDGERSLTVDPGVFSEIAAALDGAQAVLVTHEHPDHVDVGELVAAVRRDPQLRVYAPAPVVELLSQQLDGDDERVTAVAPGQAFDAAGFSVRVLGGQHALIHPTIPMVANNGYLIDDAIYHAGDSFVVPSVPVEVLIAPIHAPWSKVAEVIDFVVAVRAPRVIGAHEAGLSQIGRDLVEGHVARIGGEHGSDYLALAPSESVDV